MPVFSIRVRSELALRLLRAALSSGIPRLHIASHEGKLRGNPVWSGCSGATLAARDSDFTLIVLGRIRRDPVTPQPSTRPQDRSIMTPRLLAVTHNRPPIAPEWRGAGRGPELRALAPSRPRRTPAPGRNSTGSSTDSNPPR